MLSGVDVVLAEFRRVGAKSETFLVCLTPPNDTLTGGRGNDYFVFSNAGFGTDIITDYEDGLDKVKVHSSIANNIAAFNITGNGTTSVVLTQISSPTNTITLQGATAINITAADFVFY